MDRRIADENPLVYYQLRHLPTLGSATAIEGCSYSLKARRNEQSGFRCTSFPDDGLGIRAGALLEGLRYAYDGDRYEVTLQVLSPLHLYAPWISKSQLTSKSFDGFKSNSNAFYGYKSSLKSIKKHIISQCNKHFGSSIGEKRSDRQTRNAWVEKLPSFVWVPVSSTDTLPIINGCVHVKMFLSERSHQVSTPTRVTRREPRQPPVTTTWQETPMTEFGTSDYPSDPPMGAPEQSLDKLSITEKQEIRERIHAWSHTQTGKLKDIRSLLSTIEEVLWSDASWKTMPTSALVGDKDAIKKYYRLALLKCHPDKQKVSGSRRKLESELITQALQDAWSNE